MNRGLHGLNTILRGPEAHGGMDGMPQDLPSPYTLSWSRQVSPRALDTLRVHVHPCGPPHQEPLSAVSSFSPAQVAQGLS